jgi:hypothetical protein
MLYHLLELSGRLSGINCWLLCRVLLLSNVSVVRSSVVKDIDECQTRVTDLEADEASPYSIVSPK